MAIGYQLAVWENNRERATHAWLLLASQDHPLPLVYDTVSSVPGVRDHDMLRRVFGSRQITAVVLHSADADKLLAMPPCPVKLLVNTIESTPPEAIRRLKERLGDAVK
jgi:hypothetical protein